MGLVVGSWTRWLRSRAGIVRGVDDVSMIWVGVRSYVLNVDCGMMGDSKRH